MKKLLSFLLLGILPLASFAADMQGGKAEYNPKYFPNHTENIWLFPDWPFYNPVGISKGDDVHVSNDNFATYKQGKLWSSVVDSDYQVVSVNGFDMPTNWQAWPTYRIDNDILNSYTHIRLADGSTPVEPPPVVEPEPPVVEEPEPEPPVIVEPEPEVPPVVDPINKAQLYGLMTRIENLLNTEDPRAAFSTAASMMRDKADLLERVGIMRQLISEAE